MVSVSAPIGGGQYERGTEVAGPRTAVVGDPTDPLVNAIQVSLPPEIAFFDNVADALVDAQSSWNPGEDRVIEIVDSATYTDNWPPITIPANGRLVVRAANEQRPTLLSAADITIDGGDGSAVALNGLLIGGSGLVTSGALNSLEIAHCTFVPGRTLEQDGTTPTPGAVSLAIESGTTEAVIRASILGAIESAALASVSITDSVLDAHDVTNAAYGGAAAAPFGGTLTIVRSTVIGTIRTSAMELGENSILLGLVTAERRQQGCVR
jgi:hypothetical protein